MSPPQARMSDLSPKAIPSRQYRARIIRIDDVLADTRVLWLEAEHGEKVSFAAGQYAQLHLPGVEPRPFSIASSPASPYLELHIRNTGAGISLRAAEDLKLGDPVIIEAPFGDAYWRPSERPLLALAGGLGIAPIKSILETMLAAQGTVPAFLYWGVRHEGQLYLDALFRKLALKNNHLTYIPLVSDEASTRLRQGFLGDALKEDFGTLSGFDVYLAGPLAMIEALFPLLLDMGAEENRIFSDRLEAAKP